MVTERHEMSLLALFNYNLSWQQRTLITCALVRAGWDYMPGSVQNYIEVFEAYSAGECQYKNLYNAWLFDTYHLPESTSSFVNDIMNLVGYPNTTNLNPIRNIGWRCWERFLSGLYNINLTNNINIAESMPEIHATAKSIWLDVVPPALSSKRISSTAITGLVSAIKQECDHKSGKYNQALFPILADAVEDASGDQIVIDHFRTRCVHVRGCWALNLVQ